MPQEKLARILGYAGLLPFLFFSGYSWVENPLMDNPTFYLKTYAAIILSFMGAIHWGVAMSVKSTQANYQLAMSVVPPLLGWLALLIPTIYGFSLLIVSFSALCLLDKEQHKQGVFPGWYYPMRVILTTIVVLCLILASLSIVMT